jgi:hypothetical protein
MVVDVAALIFAFYQCASSMVENIYQLKIAFKMFYFQKPRSKRLKL